MLATTLQLCVLGRLWLRSALTVIALGVVLAGQIAPVAAQSCPTTVRFEADPANLDLDVGWTGIYHDQEFLGLILTAALGPSSIGGTNQQLVTFTPALTDGELCSPLVAVNVPIIGRKGRAAIGARATATAPAGAHRGVRDTDKLKLVCLPP